jgi:hypothetical protein
VEENSMVEVVINPSNAAHIAETDEQVEEDECRVKLILHCSHCNHTGHFRTTCAALM